MRTEPSRALVALLGALMATPASARAAEPAAAEAPTEPAEAQMPAEPAGAQDPAELGGAPTAADPAAGTDDPASAPAVAPETPAAPATDAPATRSEPDRRRVRWYDVAPADPRRLSIAAHLQVDVIGLAIGVRPEVLYRPFRATRGANLRVGFGLLPGPEYFFLPLDLGWRQHFVPHHRVTLELGAGYEQQFFFVRDAPAVTRGYFYTELGLAVRVASRGWLGVQLVPGWAPFSRPGPGLATRLGFRWDFGGRARGP